MLRSKGLALFTLQVCKALPPSTNLSSSWDVLAAVCHWGQPISSVWLCLCTCCPHPAPWPLSLWLPTTFVSQKTLYMHRLPTRLGMVRNYSCFKILLVRSKSTPTLSVILLEVSGSPHSWSTWVVSIRGSLQWKCPSPGGLPRLIAPSPEPYFTRPQSSARCRALILCAHVIPCNTDTNKTLRPESSFTATDDCAVF